MNTSLFSSGFRQMESSISSPSRSSFNSPLFKVKSPKLEEIEPLEQPETLKDDDSFVEPILKENPTRFTLFPIQKPKLYQKYKNHVAVFWTPEEIDLAKDMKDWVKLSTNEQMFIKNILAFFAGSDGIIQENLAARFQREVQSPVARLFYAF